MSRRRLIACAALAALLLWATPAAASGGHGFDISGDYLMAGVDLGLTLDGGANPGALVGVEFSYVELDAAGPWIGAVLAFAWLSDPSPDVGRITIGGKIGYGFAGLEGGLNLDTEGRFGGRLRALGSLGVISLYVGAAFDDETRAEIGLLLKAPIEL